ncbi:hypothetical protein OS493_004165 [Desmophyllum pertusum]|uniref:Hexosyltransferase n=1 Tax=Desmophyllum pertusum TaxID=174260 RepID=A0A9W9ZST4_9CNID|nr:hypothetical protein OS493_004165 [Desmophyllum pertusum]
MYQCTLHECMLNTVGIFPSHELLLWRLESYTSSSNQLCNCTQSASEQELEKATRRPSTVQRHPRHVNTDSTWKPGHRTTLITNTTCAQHYSFLILVSSAPANLQRRNNIRKTWAFESAFKPRWTTVFLVAQTRLQNESNSLSKEDEVYGDLVRGAYYDHYWNQTLKIQMGFEWAIMYCKFSFLLKVDDDVFVNSAEVISFLSKPSTPNKKLYMGRLYEHYPVHRSGKWKVTDEEYREAHWPNFCPGFGFILSHDVVVTFVDAFAVLPYFRLDDVYVGMLAKKTRIKVINNAGFELEDPEKPEKQCIPNEGTLVRHGYGTVQEECLIEISIEPLKYAG